MTLMLQLLFEPAFKRSYTAVMLKHYTRLMEEWSVKPPEAVMPLDMITVQLFNDEVSTITQTVLSSHGFGQDLICYQMRSVVGGLSHESKLNLA